MLWDALTPSENFIGARFSQKFESNKTWKATVMSFAAGMPPHHLRFFSVVTALPNRRSSGTNTTLDVFTLKYTNRETMLMAKGELITHLTNANDPRLLQDDRWQLRGSLLDFRFVNFSVFMLDMYAVMAKLSCSQQSNSTTLFDTIGNVSKTLASLATLKDTPAKHESEFNAACALDMGADIYRSQKLADGRQGRLLVALDRTDVLEGLSSHLQSRFVKVLDNPAIHAYAIFDHRKWPEMGSPNTGTRLLLDAFGTPEVTLMYSRYKLFFIDASLPVVLEQWKELKVEVISAPGLFNMKFGDLWPRMLTHFTEKYSFVLRLVVFMLLMPLDTSICERIFSLMNNIKTSDRSRLGQCNVRNLMAWHALADDSLATVPWISILKEFKLLSGSVPRVTHRAFTGPVDRTTATS